MRKILFLFFLLPLSLFGQRDSALLSDSKLCLEYLQDISEYPWYNTIEIDTKNNVLSIFILFYKIDTTLYENQTISVKLDNYENHLRFTGISDKYLDIESVNKIVSIMMKNQFMKIEFLGPGDCARCAILISNGKYGYAYSNPGDECYKDWCTFPPKRKKDKILFEGLLYISNLDKYFKN